MAAVAEGFYMAMPDFSIDPELHRRGSSPRVLRRTTEAVAFIQQMTLSRFGRTWLDVQQSFEEARTSGVRWKLSWNWSCSSRRKACRLKGNRLPLLPFLYNIHLSPRNRVAHTRHSRAQDKLRVQSLQLDAGVGGCEFPVGFGVVLVAVVLPCGDFVARICLSAMRRSRHCDARTPSSDSAGQANCRAWGCNAIRTARRAGGPRARERPHRARLACGC
jgi:hypothetical protein